MKKKLSIFLFLFIISLFGNIKKEQLENKHIYHFFTHEIKEKKEEITSNYHILSSSHNITLNINKLNFQPNNHNFIINFKFFPILKSKINKIKFYNYYFFDLFSTILNRYPKRVLRF